MGFGTGQSQSRLSRQGQGGGEGEVWSLGGASVWARAHAAEQSWHWVRGKHSQLEEPGGQSRAAHAGGPEARVVTGWWEY